MRDRTQTPEETLAFEELPQPLKELLEQGYVIDGEIHWGGVSEARAEATGDKPSVDLGDAGEGVSGDGGSPVEIFHRVVHPDNATPIAMGGGILILLLAAFLLYRGRIQGALIAGALGASLVAVAFNPLFLWVILGVALVGLGLYFWNTDRNVSLQDTLSRVTTAVKNASVENHVKTEMRKTARKSDKRNIERAKARTPRR